MKRLEYMPYRILNVLLISEKYFGIPVDKILGKSHKPDIVTARHACIHCLYKLSERQGSKTMSKTKLGGWFNRDHTSIIHSIQNVQNWLDVDPIFKGNYEAFAKHIEPLDVFGTKKTRTIEERIMLLPADKKLQIFEILTTMEKQNEAKS